MPLSHILEELLCKNPQPGDLSCSLSVPRPPRHPVPRCPGGMGPCLSPGNECGTESSCAMCCVGRPRLSRAKSCVLKAGRCARRCQQHLREATGTCGRVLEASGATATFPEPQSKKQNNNRLISQPSSLKTTPSGGREASR